MKVHDLLEDSKSKFQKITYDQFERLSSNTDDYEETEIDGKRVMAVYKNKNCIGMFYQKAKVCSSCPQFKGDMIAYAEADTLWPYGN